MQIRKPLNTVVVKTTGSRCNLNCSYCFYLNKKLQYDNQGVMSEETLRVFIQQIMQQSGNSFGIVWQGGEPTLAGAGFFIKAIEFMQQFGDGKNKLISNLLQTNGYSLSEDLIEVLSSYSFLVGLSLDGPEDIHDVYRKTASGKGSWQQIMNSWNKFQSKKIATNILCCVTSKSVNQADKLYNFFHDRQMDWQQFIPVFEYDTSGKPAEFSVSPLDWGHFMCHIFDRWYDDFAGKGQAPSIRFIENAFHGFLGMSAPECTFMEECGNYLVLEHNGDIFSCDYLVSQNTLLGNIHQKRLIEMLNSSLQISFGMDKKNRHKDCESCQWLQYCYGGCPKYRNTDDGKYIFCESWKMFLEHSETRFLDLAEKYRQNNPGFKGDTLDASGYFV